MGTSYSRSSVDDGVLEVPAMLSASRVCGARVRCCSHAKEWCGSTEEWRGFNKELSDSARQSIVQGAVRLMPDLAQAKLALHTACLRPVTPDWLPIIGRAPGWNNVFLATGAGKKGILLSPGMGQATADLITRGSTSLSVGPCAPERFTVTATSP